MSKAIMKTLYEIVGDWRIAREIKATIPQESLRELTDEWVKTQEQLRDNPRSKNPFEIRDKRTANRTDRLKALIIETSYRRSKPKAVYRYTNRFINQSWASQGTKVGERSSQERYCAVSADSLEYKREFDKKSDPPALSRKHGWAIIELVNKTDGDEYDWPEVSRNYIIALV